MTNDNGWEGNIIPNSYRFFQNKECEFFPCHDEYKTGEKNIREFNCLFCYCPVYFVKCPGDYKRLPDGRKDCMGCSLNHEPRFWDMNWSMMKNPKADTFPVRKSETKHIKKRAACSGCVTQCEGCKPDRYCNHD